MLQKLAKKLCRNWSKRFLVLKIKTVSGPFQWDQLEEQEKVLKAQLEAKQKAYDEINNPLGVVLDGLGLTLLSETQKKLQAQVDKNHEIEAKLKSERAINESLQVGLNSIWLKLTFL